MRKVVSLYVSATVMLHLLYDLLPIGSLYLYLIVLCVLIDDVSYMLEFDTRFGLLCMDRSTLRS